MNWILNVPNVVAMPRKLGPTFSYVQVLLQTFFLLLFEAPDMSVRAEEKNMIEDSFGRGGGGEDEEEMAKEMEVGEKQTR